MGVGGCALLEIPFLNCVHYDVSQVGIKRGRGAAAATAALGAGYADKRKRNCVVGGACMDEYAVVQ